MTKIEGEPNNENPEIISEIEVERPYLLASEADAKRLETKIKTCFPETSLIDVWDETSYYFPTIFKAKTLQLAELVLRHRPHELNTALAKLDRIPDDMPIQVRFRRRMHHDDSYFVLTFKASSDPLHDVERIEINTGDISQNFLGGFAGNGMVPTSVWRANRREYKVDESTKIDVEDVTGYGSKAEIEASDLNRVDEVATILGLAPAKVELMSAMYERYCNNWQSYVDSEGSERYFSEEDWGKIELASGEKIVRNIVN